MRFPQWQDKVVSRLFRSDQSELVVRKSSAQCSAAFALRKPQTQWIGKRTPSAIGSHVPLALLLLSTAFPAFANADLAHQKSCNSCHAMDSKRIGPSYQAIAARYAGNTGAVSALTAKVLGGGGGAWGAVPMPANNQVTKDEATRIVQWILTLR